jgi:hypothetical protein
MGSIRSLAHAVLFIVPLSLAAITGCGSKVEQATGGAGGDGTGGSSTDGDCSKDEPCSDGEACFYAPGSCSDDAKGHCVGVIQCDGPYTGPVCGCDGKTIEGEYASCNTAKYDDPAACQVGTFACGPTLQCKRNSDVCIAEVPGVPGPTTYSCKPFDQVAMPGWCTSGIPFCDCIDPTMFGGSATCAADADHQETITVMGI